MRRDEQFPITQPKTDPIDDMNIMRMRPYFLGDVDDVEYRAITSILWEKTSDTCVAVNTLVKTSLAHHSGTLKTSPPSHPKPRVFTPSVNNSAAHAELMREQSAEQEIL